MSDYKEDLRIQKTRRDLRKAIFELVIAKQFGKITVTEICNQALVNRMTFYKYYEDKYQLLDDAMQAIRDDIVSSLDNSKIETIDDATSYCTAIIEKVLICCNDNIELLKALKRNGNQELSRIIVKVCEDSISNLFTEIDKIRPLKYPIPLLTSFVYGGFASSIDYWIDHQNAINYDDYKKIISDLRYQITNSNSIFK